MRHLFILLFFSITSLYTHAQLAVILDPDGYVNMRSEPQDSGKIIRKLTIADIFYCFELEGEWYSVDVYVKDSTQLTSGYIHRSRVKFINKYDSISLSQVSKDKIVFKNKMIQVEVKTKSFDPKANTMEYAVDNVNHRYVKTINHKPVWGTDGGVPSVSYEYIWVTIGVNKIVLPAEAYESLFQPNFQFMKVNYDVQNDIIYIQGLNSDGAGGYIFAVIIKNKKFEKTVAMIPF